MAPTCVPIATRYPAVITMKKRERIAAEKGVPERLGKGASGWSAAGNDRTPNHASGTMNSANTAAIAGIARSRGQVANNRVDSGVITTPPSESPVVVNETATGRVAA